MYLSKDVGVSTHGKDQVQLISDAGGFGFRDDRQWGVQLSTIIARDRMAANWLDA